MNRDERYRMTEHGVAIREQYVWVLFSAQEAVALANWLLWHYGELESMRRKHLEEQQKAQQEGKQLETDAHSASR